MGDGHDDNLGWSEAIDDLVRKPRHQGTSGEAIAGDHRADSRIAFDQRESYGHGVEELSAQARAWASYQRTASLSSSEAGSLVWTGSFTDPGSLFQSGASRRSRARA